MPPNWHLGAMGYGVKQYYLSARVGSANPLGPFLSFVSSEIFLRKKKLEELKNKKSGT